MIPGLAAAIIEINGMFIDSKIPLRSTIISINAWEREAELDINLVITCVLQYLDKTSFSL